MFTAPLTQVCTRIINDQSIDGGDFLELSGTDCACYDVTGEADFIIVITAKDMQEYEIISRKLFMENPNVRRYKTSLVVRRVKSGTIVPLVPG